MPTTVFDQFTHRIAEVTAQLDALGIPLTAPAPPPPAVDPADPWAGTFTVPVDRSSLAWCTAVQMMADHHHTGIDRQALAADSLLRELGTRGLAQLQSDLHHGAPVDHRFTRCPYCSGIGEDPTLPTCRDIGCPPEMEFADHPHLCQVCRGAEYEPEWFAEEHMARLEQLLAEAIKQQPRPLRHRIGAWLRRRPVHT
ncbi:hypothetical protein [Streptomyces sp. NBC_01789]|uniref:hypothetical protein n=1 Tax=Streptomyces sp. NBC_01789 TaxID=2975941 RepID=UPI00225225D9|nr:hypothetical protein [Streptomyces sp. NBC_01789]MCX4451672.1 hypothetical protein [Streptomyces sp. NBC_01789]